MEKQNLLILIIMGVIVVFLSIYLFSPLEVNVMETFGPKTDKTSIVNKTNHIKYDFQVNEIKEHLSEIGINFYLSNNSVTKSRTRGNGFVDNKLLDVLTDKDNYIDLPGKIISKSGYYMIVEKDDTRYLCKLENIDDKIVLVKKIKTPCNRIVSNDIKLICTTEKNDELYVFPDESIENFKTIKLDKPLFISEPERAGYASKPYAFDGLYLYRYFIDGTIETKVELEEVPINDKMIFVGNFCIDEQNEILFFDGTNAWGVSFKDKKVLWKKQNDIIGEGVDRLSCYYVPTKQGIVAISSETGETKKIVDGDGWELIDNLNSNENNTYYSGDSNVFRRKIDGKYEPLILLTTEGKAQVVRCEPYQGEDMGYIFLLDTRNGAKNSVYNFVFFTKEGAYQYSLDNPFRLHYK